ncbi:hypothetical protein [Sphingorhabdus sp. Alg239-R122]|uniref:hypothetical protein n=1 Tax=Sphingorhabdus sp. Alg239-R122 TaxID=2305989 RepID=UPI0013DC30A2|nr:hypothetical protein [Sphingorhabdus sp. Alg239-R122]
MQKQVKLSLIAATIIAAAAMPTALSAHPGPERHGRHHGDIVVRSGGYLPAAPNNDSNSYWLDYKTDISEAERELASDLRRATDAEDRRDAYEEYHNEIRDAKKDYAKEMRERGYRITSFREDRTRRYSRRR